MRRSQRKAEKYLKERGFDFVWFIHHTRWQSDIGGLFDGIGIKNGKTYFLQVSSNKFHPMKPFRDFAKKHGSKVILINVMDYKGVKQKVM